MRVLLLFIFVSRSYALEVIKPDFFRGKLELKIVRAYPDSFDTFTLINANSREMTLICEKNRVYDDNPKPMIRYRNYYNIEVGDFILDSEEVCREVGRFIIATQTAIDEDRPLLITLDKSSLKVEKIIYPNIDPFAQEGDLEDLFPKERILITPEKKQGEVSTELH